MSTDSPTRKRARAGSVLEIPSAPSTPCGLPDDPPHKSPTLPNEIFVRILKYIDTPTAVVLLRVSRYLSALAEPLIWKRLRVHLPEHYGEVPYIQPVDYLDKPRWDKEMAESVQAACRKALKEKAAAIIPASTARKWGMVVTVAAMPIPGALLGLTTILELASPRLRQLELIRPPPTKKSADTREPLELMILEHELHFPSLTRVYLQPGTIKHIDFLPLLFKAAPGLTCLDVTIDTELISPLPTARFPNFKEVNHLRELRICFADITAQHHPVFIALLRYSRRIQLLNIEYGVKALNQKGLACSCLFGLVAGLGKLTNLQWEVSAADFSKALAKAQKKHTKKKALFRSLSVLVLRSEAWLEDTFLNIPALPCLRELHFDIPSAPTSLEGVDQNPSSALPMIPEFAKRIRECPELFLINTVQRGIITSGISYFKRLTANMLADAWNNEGSAAYIRSFMYGIAEVVEVTIDGQHVQIGDVLPGDGLFEEAPGLKRVGYTAADGSDRELVLEKRERAEQRLYTDYEGMCVPQDVISSVRELSKEEQGVFRRVEVSDAGWAVLQDWRKGGEAVPVEANQEADPVLLQEVEMEE